MKLIYFFSICLISNIALAMPGPPHMVEHIEYRQCKSIKHTANNYIVELKKDFHSNVVSVAIVKQNNKLIDLVSVNHIYTGAPNNLGQRIGIQGFVDDGGTMDLFQLLQDPNGPHNIFFLNIVGKNNQQHPYSIYNLQMVCLFDVVRYCSHGPGKCGKE